VLLESVLIWLCRNFSTLEGVREIDVLECKGIDEFREAEGTELRVLLLTIMPRLEIINQEAVKEEELTAARQLMHASSVT